MEVIIQTRVIHLKKRSITWVIRENNVVSPIIIKIICLKVGEPIRTKVLGGNKMLVHLTGKALLNNNHSILQLKRERAYWRIP